MNGAINGRTSATHAASKESWRIPTAWRATVRNGRIAEWQIYANNKPVYKLLSEHVQLIAEDNRWLAYWKAEG
jgi:hypothetical protein